MHIFSTKLADGIGELRQQELCQNLTVKCFYKSDGKPKEFCAKFVIDHSSSTDSDATSLLDPGKHEPSPTDQLRFGLFVAVGGVAGLRCWRVGEVGVVEGCSVVASSKKKQMQTQNQGEELTEQNRLDDGDQPAPGNGIPLVFAGRGTFY
ncbi:unnamed protein product [Boreogadus saida]